MSSESWAWEKDLGFDADGFQRKQACQGIGRCPTCGKDVELVAETEEWVERDGRKVHNSYGPACGVCCDVLIVDSWDGCSAYDLSGDEDCEPDDDFDDYDYDPDADAEHEPAADQVDAEWQPGVCVQCGAPAEPRAALCDECRAYAGGESCP